ncbi:hypothetical protein K2173_025450 [Erythroxylum novogranatense]|uniref:ARID domain-containing protein n=1 Tax=Erythroxylum novogranatense TaxID=1862640 RepID=A0AAV8UGM7_9ROSI|nr:hypothetical protein K2173_025450 [Erythroxylum novogranatense]
MAGWSMVADNGHALDCVGNPQKKLGPDGLLVDFEEVSRWSALKTLQPVKTYQCWFTDLVKIFLKNDCALEAGFWTLPPMLGDGQPVDLLNLFLVVRNKGGYDAVCKNGTWDLVAEESGLGLSLASSVKLVYIKYLDALEKWLQGFIDEKHSKSNSNASSSGLSGVLMELGAQFNGFLRDAQGSKYLDLKSELNLNSMLESCESEKCDVDDEESSLLDSSKAVVGLAELQTICLAELQTICNKVVNCSEMDSSTCGEEKSKGENPISYLRKSVEACNEDDKSMVMEMCEINECANVMELELDNSEELSSSRKRKRESLHKMLNWVTWIARDPCGPDVAALPERAKWNSFGSEELWKQVLLFRETFFLKRSIDSSTEQSWQKYQKMHPCMYDDHVGTSYNLRERLKCSRKLFLGDAHEAQSSSSATQRVCHDDFLTEHPVLELPPEKEVPLGPDFQVEVPEWKGLVSESDVKWLGTKIWPLAKVESKFIIERDPIGKGRQDSCGCEVPKSTECVRFHTTEQKLKVKRELGIAFHQWRFDKMGEEVKLSWKKEEEEKFKTIVRSNPSSLDKCFWDEIVNSFTTKKREDLVSYYYNVFLLQRRAQQNRCTPSCINSDDDDDEPEFVLVTNGHEAAKSPGSLIRSGKKVPKNVK